MSAYVFVVIFSILVSMVLGPAESMATGRVRKERDSGISCGTTTYYRRPTGVLTSDYYPGPYPHNTLCYYQMRIPYGGLYTVHLKVCKVDLECGKDKLEIYDGDSGGPVAMMCSEPVGVRNLTLEKTCANCADREPIISFHTNNETSYSGFKIAYCFEDKEGISLRCASRSDFNCERTDYDYIRYRNPKLTDFYTWEEVSTHEAPDPPITSGVTGDPREEESWRDQTSTLGPATSLSEDRNTDSRRLILDLMTVYNNAKFGVLQSWNTQNAAVNGLIHAIEAANRNPRE